MVWSDIEACLARLATGRCASWMPAAALATSPRSWRPWAIRWSCAICRQKCWIWPGADRREGAWKTEFVSSIAPFRISQHVTGTFDLVLCHAVLEWLAEPRQTLLGLFPFVKAGGILSLLFYNRHGLLFQSLVVGNFDYVRLGLRKKRQTALTPTNPQLPEQVYDWIGRGD
jgi:S-adenosylmethionine-dependent methyltransferase